MLEPFPYDLEMIMNKHDQNNKRFGRNLIGLENGGKRAQLLVDFEYAFETIDMLYIF